MSDFDKFLSGGSGPGTVQPPECLKDFIGAKIQVENETVTLREGTPRERNFTVTKPVKDEPTLTAMYNAAAENNIHLRIHTPGSMATMDYRMGRLNARVEQNDDGDWVVSDEFRYG